jgi:hypothetical protein
MIECRDVVWHLLSSASKQAFRREAWERDQTCSGRMILNVTEQVANLLRQRMWFGTCLSSASKQAFRREAWERDQTCSGRMILNVTEQVANLLRQNLLRQNDFKRYGAGCKPAPAEGIKKIRSLNSSGPR